MSLDDHKAIKRIQDAMAQDPRWQVIVLGNNWLCPYCGEIGARNLSMEAEVELEVLRHLRSVCPEWRAFGGELLSKKKLDKRALSVSFQARVGKLIRSDRRFDFFDDKGHWLCPLCLASVKLAGRDKLAGRAKHLRRCPTWAERKEKGIVPEGVAVEALERANKKIRARQVKKSLKSNPAWTLCDAKRRWLCPYCAGFPGLTLSASPRSKEVVKILAHLETCSEAHELAVPERDLRSLKAILTREQKKQSLKALRRKTKKYPAWFQRDMEIHWYCPFCASRTDIYFPEASRDDAATLMQALRHFERCPCYGKNEPRPLEVIERAVEQSNKLIKLKREIRRSLSSDARFTVANILGAWACPYCRLVVSSIDLPKGAESVELPPVAEKIARHLLHDCEGYGRRDPLPAAELSAIADGRVRPTLAPRQMPSLEEDVLISLGREVAELKTFLHNEREGLVDARNKQRRLLPRMPELPGYDFGYYYEPCEALGGDFYDFVPSSTGLGIAIGDIAGHGIGAGLLMGLAKKLLEIHGRDRSSPQETLCLANRDIFPDLDERTFVTVCYSLLDPVSRTLRIARAGHNPLILYNPARDPELVTFEPQGIALGMDAGKLFDKTLKEELIQLESGDLVFQYTDGITECQNEQKEELGTRHLHQIIRSYGKEEAEYVIFKVVKALEAFRGSARVTDDITLLAFKVL